MLERDLDLLQWCIEADGLEVSEVRELGEPGDLERMQAMRDLGLLDFTLNEWFVPTARGRAAVASN